MNGVPDHEARALLERFIASPAWGIMQNEIAAERSNAMGDLLTGVDYPAMVRAQATVNALDWVLKRPQEMLDSLQGDE